MVRRLGIPIAVAIALGIGLATLRGSTALQSFSFSISPAVACGCDGGYPGLLFDGGATYCTKHSEFAGIQPGDMVYCPGNTPRFMPGGDGGGDIGIQAWASRRNGLTYSQQFDNAAWSKSGTASPGAPTVTANGCVAPDGTQTAELVLFGAAAGGELSYLEETNCQITYDVRTVYVRASLSDGGAGDGTTTATLQIGGNTAQTWTFGATGYTRIRQVDTDPGDIASYFDIVSRGPIGEQYVCVWQADCQQNTDQDPDPWPPPILTTNAAVTREADVARLDPQMFPMWTNYTQTATLVTENGLGTARLATLLDVNTGTGVDGNRMYRKGSVLQCDAERGSTTNSAYSYPSVASGAQALTCVYDGDPNSTGRGLIYSCIGGVCGDAGFLDAGVVYGNRVNIGSMWNNVDWVNFANGVVKNISISENARKDIYLFGDSIVEGNNAGDGFQPQYVVHRARGNSVSVTNSAVSGRTAPQCVDDMTTRLNYVVDAGMQNRSFFVLQCGVNSSADGAAATLARLVGVLALAQDAGVHVIGSTITPYSAINSYIQAVNSGLRSWGTSSGVSIADTFSALEYPPGSGQLSSAYDYGDAVHLNDAGTQLETIIWMSVGGW